MIQSLERQDTYLHKGLRNKLVDELKAKGITDTKVLQVINTVPRHYFIEPAFEHIAYINRAISITAGQTISHPYTVAYQTQLLQIKPFDKILEVGTGSAYQACVLAEMGAAVYTIERQKKLYEEINHFFYLKNYHNIIKRFYGDGYEGLPSYAPFDKVIITAATPNIPMNLINQLKIGGIMVAPIGNDDQQVMTRVTKTETGFEEEVFENFSFVPMLRGKE